MKFGSQFANTLRRKQRRPNDVWHLDEVVVMVAGKPFHLWRAVDQHGIVLEEILQSKRSKKVAKRLLTRLIKRKDFIPFRKREKTMQGFRPSGGLNVSEPSILPLAIASSSQPAALQSAQSVTTEWRHSTHGRRRQILLNQVSSGRPASQRKLM